MVDEAFIDDFKVHDVDAAGFPHALSGVAGLLATPGPKVDRQDRARAHGSSDYTRFYEGKVIGLRGITRGDTVGDFHDRYDELRAAFALKPDGTDRVFRFRRTGRDYVERVVCRVAADLPFDPEGGKRRREKWAVTLYAPDPRLYEDGEQENFYSPSAAAGGGLTLPITFPLTFSGDPVDASMSITVGGTYPTPPRYTILGPATDVEIRNETTGESVFLDGTIPGASTLTVDVARRRIELDGTERADFLDPAQTVWGELAPNRVNVLRMVATGITAGTTRLAVNWRNARI